MITFQTKYKKLEEGIKKVNSYQDIVRMCVYFDSIQEFLTNEEFDYFLTKIHLRLDLLNLIAN